jgi:hypothetical protein
MGLHRLVILLALALAMPALAQDGRVWNFDDNPEAPALGFGAPDSDDVVIGFSCEPSAKQMTTAASVGSTRLVPGPSVSLKLSAGTTSLELIGNAIANETDGTVSMEVTGAPNPRLFALLRAGPSLTIEVPGATETIPLGGAAPHVATFEKLCLGRR